MKFGLLGYTELQTGKPGSFARICEEAQALEEAGFDYYSLIEHHQADYGEFSAPLVWLAGVAARTKSIAVGVTLILPPLYHPIRLAEDAASVDIISEGRLFLGAAVGYQQKDFAAMGVPMSERAPRMRETLEILRLAWGPDPFTYEGKIYSFKDVQVTPKPVQKPIPLWGGGVAEAAVRRAGRLCDGWLVSNNTLPSQLERLVPLYRETARQAGKEPFIALCRNTWVADSIEEAKAVYGPAILKHYRLLDQYSGAREGVGRPPWQEIPDPFGDTNFILGSPEDCIRQIDRYRERFGVNALFLRMRTPQGPEQSLVLRAIERFGRDVIRHYRQL